MASSTTIVKATPVKYGIQRTRWRLRVYTSDVHSSVENHSIYNNFIQLITEERGFFTAEAAVRHMQTRMSSWNQVKHFVVLIDEEEGESHGESAGD